MLYTYTKSPVGRLLLAGEEGGLGRVAFTEGRHAQRPGLGWRASAAPFAEAVRQLAAYFAGARTAFDLPLAL